MESNSTKLALISRFLRLELLSLSSSPLAKVKADTGRGWAQLMGWKGGMGPTACHRTPTHTLTHVCQVTPANNNNAHTHTYRNRKIVSPVCVYVCKTSTQIRRMHMTVSELTHGDTRHEKILGGIRSQADLHVKFIIVTIRAT